MVIGIINIGIGNIMSIINILRFLGYYKIIMVSKPVDLLKCNKIIFPGQGSFLGIKDKLIKLDLLKAISLTDKKFLGICLGMHILFCFNSEGMSIGTCLSNKHVQSFRGTSFLKVPNIGWNKVNIIKPNPFINKTDYFYFSHSFYLGLDSYSIGSSFYGSKFCSFYRRRNFLGVQFHPEKSGFQGINLLSKFLKW
ncbi:imidazole glycerol phosphate synthase subunit HisH [Candidatus Vidania fulgoroideorum]